MTKSGITSIDKLYYRIEQDFKDNQSYKKIQFDCRVLKIMSYPYYTFITLGSLTNVQLDITGSINNSILKEELEHDDVITVAGDVDFNRKYGKVKFNIKNYKKKEQKKTNYEKIIEQLKDSFFFDIPKKQIPSNIRNIALISSFEASGLKDFLDIVSPYPIKFMLFDSRMQGEKTEEGIINNINKINKKYTDIQLICIMRGGGAKSDLEWLNNFNIATAIKKSDIPIICGIGHETDNSILDIVCDHSCTTPSNLAHYVVDNSVKSIKTKLKSLLNSFNDYVDKFIITSENLETKLDSLTKDILKTQLYGLERSLYDKSTYLDNLIRYSITKHRESQIILEENIKININRSIDKIQNQVNSFNSLISFYNNSFHKVNNNIQNQFIYLLNNFNRDIIKIDKQEEKVKDILSHLNKELEKFNPIIKINNKQIFTKREFLNELNKHNPDNYKIVFVDGVLIMEL